MLGRIVGGGGCHVFHVDFRLDVLEEVNFGAESAKDALAVLAEGRGGGGGAS